MVAACFVGCTKTDDKPADGDKKIKMPSLTYLYNTSDSHQKIGEAIQADFAKFGVTVNLQNQEWNTFLNTRKEGDYSIARNGWVADYSDPICFLDMWTTASGNNDVQFGKGAHKDLAMYSVDLTKFGGEKVENGTWAQTYDVLISKIKAEEDETKRFELMHMAEDLLMSTGCIVPLYFYTDLYMIKDTVKGFYSSPLGYKYFQNCTIEGQDYINVCLASEPDTIDPALNSAVDGASLCAHLFSGLAKWAQDENGNLYIAPDCVTELVAGVKNDDGTVTYTYTLRDGLKWSDGQELKASDFEYAWKRAASATLGADYGYMFEVVKGYGADDVDGLAPLAVTSDDAAKTITVTLANSVAYWNELLAFPAYYPVRKDVVSNEKWATEPATYVGNGPYKMTGWDHNSTITLEKNADFVDADKVTMNKIVFYLSDDNAAMLTNYQKGDWQMIDDVPVDEIENLKKEKDFVIAGQIGTYYVCWNINLDLLPGSELKGVEKEKAQVEIRKALALVIDRNNIVENITKTGQVPASSFVAMGMKNPDGTEFYKTANGGESKGYAGYYNISKDAYSQNCKDAEAVLAKYYDLSK